MKKLLLLAAVLVVWGSSLYGQSAELTGLGKRDFKGVFPILNKSTQQPEGYYCFYVNEKESGGMVNFVISLFDLNMKMVKQTPISITKRSIVDGSEFNGSDFLFVFNDYAKKAITYVTMDKAGNIIQTKGIVEEKFYSATADVYSAGSDGFIIVKPIRTPKRGYNVEKVDRNLKTMWNREFSVDKGYTYAEAVEVANKRVVLIEVTGESVMSRRVDVQLRNLDAGTGKDVFQFNLSDGETTAMPTALVIDENQNIVTGGMYFKGDKMNNSESEGIFFTKISPTGKQLAASREGWDEGIRKVLKEATAKRFAITSRPQVYFQSIVQAEDGSYQIIGETFRRSYAAAGFSFGQRSIGSASQNTQPVTFEVLDFVVFNFDGAGSMTNLNFIEKPHTKLTLLEPYNGMGPLAQAKYVDRFGLFDYAFMMTLPDSDQEYIVSANYQKAAYIGFTTIVPGAESVTQTLPVDRKEIRGGAMGVMPHSPGNVAIYVFDKKDETVLIYVQPVKF